MPRPVGSESPLENTLFLRCLCTLGRVVRFSKLFLHSLLESGLGTPAR